MSVIESFSNSVGWHLRMTWSQEFCSASLHSEPASALGSPTVWSLWGNLGVARCQEMSTLPAGYIPKHKGTWASSSGLLGFHCVWSVVGWLIVHQDGNYLQPIGQYSQTICPSQIFSPKQPFYTILHTTLTEFIYHLKQMPLMI